MKRFFPLMYYPNIESISYNKLKQMGIRYLIFDLDNTVGLLDSIAPSEKTVLLLSKLKKDFTVIIVSNNFKKRVSSYFNGLDFFFISFAMKPTSRSLRFVKKKFGAKKEEMVMIGDQLVTDIWGANRFGIASILVDPLGKKEMKITSINRYFEKKILKKYQETGILERGKYYD